MSPFYTNSWVIRLWLSLEASLFIFGITLPLAHIDQFWILADDISMLHILDRFWDHDELLLFLTVFLFGVLFPFAKILLKFLSPNHIAIGVLYRFALTDIFLVALLVYVVKGMSMIEISLGIGFYALLGSVLVGHGLQLYDRFSKAPSHH